ncbi:hypothetical protein G5I_14245 [Acromyrmex echinatior]|uniref:Uncharacterized protein n=1 Tax=Acromyrmex echinatior TaxID=103372 RepID=F4X7A6_ACREC|nr:hypothetical protein G5I_14245 [Acromyrmex echinatior]
MLRGDARVVVVVIVVIVTRPDRYYFSVFSVSCGEFAGQRDGSRITPITVRWFVSRQVQQVQVRRYPAMQDAVIFESRTLVRLFLGVFGTEAIGSFSRDINDNGGSATSSYITGLTTSSCRMLSPGQDTPPSNYSSGNVVLQGAPCGQCRDLCPAGYVPHFWRNAAARRERVKTSRAVLRSKSTSKEDLKVFKFLSNSHAKATTGSDILLRAFAIFHFLLRSTGSATTTIVAQLRSERSVQLLGKKELGRKSSKRGDATDTALMVIAQRRVPQVGNT